MRRLAEPVEQLRMMMLIRAFEDALAQHPERGFQLLSSGEEAVAVGLCSALAPADQLLTGGRAIGPALARGIAPARVMAELLGKASGTNRGKGGRGHLAEPADGFFGAHAVVGGNISIAAGVALSRQLAGQHGIVAVMFGDGACGAGVLHETLNIAAIWRLPLLFVCNNNQLSVATPRQAVLAPKRLSDLAGAFAIPASTVDGMDVAAVASAIGEAAARIRAGDGPAFIECLSHRFRSHSTAARDTRTKAELADMQVLCPILRHGTALRAAGILNEVGRQALADEVARIVAEAEAFADAAPFPDPGEVTRDVW
jgi:TPP-dependent pyruvate/acetoin dehydrogenase alpha subunit